MQVNLDWLISIFGVSIIGFCSLDYLLPIHQLPTLDPQKRKIIDLTFKHDMTVEAGHEKKYVQCRKCLPSSSQFSSFPVTSFAALHHLLLA